MFKFLKAVFGADYLFNMGEKNVARITTNNEGKAVLYSDGEAIGTYSRARDAKRAALRRGLTIA